MGRAGAAGAVARLCPLGHIFLLTPLMGPRARSRKSDQNAPIPLTAVEKDPCRLAGHDRKSQLGVGSRTGGIANLARTSEDSQYLAESCLTNGRRRGVQIVGPSGVDPRGEGPSPHAQEPIVAQFLFARSAIS